MALISQMQRAAASETNAKTRLFEVLSASLGCETNDSNICDLAQQLVNERNKLAADIRQLADEKTKLNQLHTAAQQESGELKS